MKCELCHEKDAETAIAVTRKGAEEELYVCKQCAKKEKSKHQRKSQRTRKMPGLPPGVEMSVTEISGGDSMSPQPIIEALMDVVNDAFNIVKSKRGESPKSGGSNGADDGSEGSKWKTVSCERINSDYRIGRRLHLEGIGIMGEIDSVRRAMNALDMCLVGINLDGVRDAGHAYELQFRSEPGDAANLAKRARRVLKELVRQEENARMILRGESRRVYDDSICRALAILKNCRVLGAGELFDLLSPIRLAALDGRLDGISLDEVMKMISEIELIPSRAKHNDGETDMIEFKRADNANMRFEDVLLDDDCEGERE